MVQMENRASLDVRQGTENQLEASSEFKGSVSVKGDRLILDGNVYYGTLRIQPNSGIRFELEDHANLNLEGDFEQMQRLAFALEDHATVNVSGHDGDTLRCDIFSVKVEDNATFHSSIPIKYQIKTFDIEDNGTINTLEPIALSSKLPRVDQHANSSTAPLRPRSWWASEGTRLDFAWGLHNWGDQPLVGFGGTSTDAAVRTSFNDVQLALSGKLFACGKFALFGGLGIEWTKYKFEANYVGLPTTGAEPYQLTDLTTSTPSGADFATRLKMRYVTLPITLAFGNPNGWHVDLSAIPGLHWGGNNTGFRYQSDNVRTRDYAVNRYINPLKLDARVQVAYDGLGAYVQTSLLSAFKGSVEPLYPVQFGIILSMF